MSTIVDAATDEVVRRLAARGIPHKRLNTEDYPFSQSVVFRPGVGATENWLESGGRSLPFPSSVWYRRLRTPPKPDGMDEGIYTFCLQETRATLLGSIMGLPVRWMSHPASVWQAEYKPFQLSLAAKVGLSVPRSVVTNDPVTVRKAFNEFGGAMVVKPVRTGHVLNEGQEYALFTSRVLQEHLDELESARWSPAIYQTLVPKRFDVRVTIVGRRVFAAAIDSQSDPAAEIDWRKTSCPHLPHQPILVPEPVTAGLLRMMDSLGLSFGAIDMVQTPEGEYVFLEINPSGQWLWLDDMLGLGISHAVAEWLAQATPL